MESSAMKEVVLEEMASGSAVRLGICCAGICGEEDGHVEQGHIGGILAISRRLLQLFQYQIYGWRFAWKPNVESLCVAVADDQGHTRSDSEKHHWAQWWDRDRGDSRKEMHGNNDC
jgi:hypothetical protein